MPVTIENVLYSIGSLAHLLAVEPWNLRRSIDRAVKAGQLPGNRLRGWRWFSPAEVPLVVEQLKRDGHLPPDFVCPPLGIVDEMGATLGRLVAGPPRIGGAP